MYETEKTETEKIQKLVNSYISSIETDLPALSSLFCNTSATLISIGDVFTGKDNIEGDFLKSRIRKAYETIRLIPESLDIRMLNDTTALILFAYHTECEKKDTLEPYGIAGMETQIAVKQGDGWKLAHVHYSKK